MADVDALTPPKIGESKGLAPVLTAKRTRSRTTTKSDNQDDDDVSEIESSQVPQLSKV